MTYLAKKGHEVTVVCKPPSDEPEMDGVKVVEVPEWSTREPLTSLKNITKSLTLVDLSRYPKLSETVRKKDPDVLHVHNLAELRTGYIVARRYDVPIVADMRELYPESLAAWRRGEPKWHLVRPHRFLRSTWRYRRLEKRLLRHVDAIMSESDEAKRHFVEEYGIPESKITPIRNVPDLERLRSYGVRDVGIEGEFVVMYIGNFTPQRELDAAIDAMRHVVDEVPGAKLYLIGDGQEAYISKLKQQRDELGLEDSVVFTGWVEFEDLPSYTAASDVSLCLLQTDNKDSQCAITNKLFQAMAFGTPILITDTEAMRRIVEKEDCGVVAESTEPEEISEKLLELYRNPELADELGENGKEAAEREYNFEKEGVKLMKVYESVLGKKIRRRRTEIKQ
ncbi:MAG: glycosyltransferase family 4 protein [Halobacteriales archaeon]|nr:glycosyltransferase family 4 protein [Halobacteriales archaeon]